jgi:dihydrolipoamide dehydrogenase
MSEHYNVAIVGAGPGGYVAALRAAARGAKTCVIEKHLLGGTCLNYGCIPSKALLASAELFHHLQHAGDWGISADNLRFDWSRIQARKDKVLAANRAGVASLFKGRGVTSIEASASLESGNSLLLTPPSGPARTITADKIILATGSSPIRIPGWGGADTSVVCTSDEAVHWPHLPKRLLIVGGGVIGCEFACMMRAFGVAVTVVELLPHLLPGLDTELGDALASTFRKRGIDIKTGTKVEDLKLHSGIATATLSGGTTLDVDRVLVCVGRKPATAAIGLDKLGVELSPKGFVQVDESLRSSIKSIYCVGDANGKALLAHAASAQGVVAADSATGADVHFTAPVPGAVYTFPEIGAVGMTEQHAREHNIPITIGRFPLARLGKAMAVNHTDGFVKVLRHRETGELLGVHMLGHNATECIAAAGQLLHHKVSVHDLAESIFAHPTISEAIKEAAEDALGVGLHLPPRKLFKVTAA